MLDHHILLVVVDQCAPRLFVHPGRMHDESMISGTHLVAGTTTFVSYKFLIRLQPESNERSSPFRLSTPAEAPNHMLLIQNIERLGKGVGCGGGVGMGWGRGQDEGERAGVRGAGARRLRVRV